MSPCSLEDWMGEQPERGMHVICVHGSSADVYPNAAQKHAFTLESGEAEPVDGLDAKELVKRIFQKVKRVSHISFPEKRLKYKNQKPSLFSADGTKQIGALSDGVHLLFEGGLWRWPPVRIGFRRELESSTLLTVALRPAVFQVIVNEEWHKKLRDYVLPTAAPLFRKSMTGDVSSNDVDDNIRSSETAFLDYGQSKELKDQETMTRAMMRVPLNRMESAMQAVSYTPGQFYDSHRDYWDPREFPNSNWLDRNDRWTNRFATVLWYLKSPAEGGETWFPRARGEDIPWGAWKACDDRGIKVKALNGTAVLFYSLLASGELDEYSWHCGCPVKGDHAKIAANSWIWSGVQRESQEEL